MTLPCNLQLLPLPLQFSAVQHSQTLDFSEHIAAVWLVELPRENVVPEPNCECSELKPHYCLKLSFLPPSSPAPPSRSRTHTTILFCLGVIIGLNVGTQIPHSFHRKGTHSPFHSRGRFTLWIFRDFDGSHRALPSVLCPQRMCMHCSRFLRTFWFASAHSSSSSLGFYPCPPATGRTLSGLVF